MWLSLKANGRALYDGIGAIGAVNALPRCSLFAILWIDRGSAICLNAVHAELRCARKFHSLTHMVQLVLIVC